MRKMIVNIMATTGITLVILAVIALLFGASWLCITVVLECFGANILIHLGFLITHKFESRYAVLESALDIGYMLIIIIIFANIFDWFSSTPLWVLVIMTILVYASGLLLSIIRMREDIRIINQLLNKRNNEVNS